MAMPITFMIANDTNSRVRSAVRRWANVQYRLPSQDTTVAAETAMPRDRSGRPVRGVSST